MVIEKTNRKTAKSMNPDGILLREMLDAQINSKPENYLANAESFFEQSREDEKTRIQNFTEWIEEVTQQPHPEASPHEDELMESAPVPQVEANSDEEITARNELPISDLDMLAAEMNANLVEIDDHKVEKAENAERSL